MLAVQKYSERLGVIDPDQLRAAAAAFELGDVREAYPAPGGVFGQNIVLVCDGGQFVLRGNPRGRVQLTKERRVARFIAEGGTLPVPWPYQVSDDTDIFGWPFAIVPRLRGEPGLEAWAIADEDGRLEIAEATGEALAALHDRPADFFGPYDGQLDDFIEMDDFAAWTLYRLEHWRAACRAVNGLSTDAERYIDALLEECAPALGEPFEPVLVHHDFTWENLSFVPGPDGPVASGVFDLGDAHLGDGEEDLVRTLRVLESDEQRVAFLDVYTDGEGLDDGAGERLAVYALSDFLIHWEFARRIGTAFDEESFVHAARPVIETARDLGRMR